MSLLQRFLCAGWVAAALSMAAALSTIGCAPAPRNVPCSNDGECRAEGGDFTYCLQNRCVECVARGTCGEGSSCVDGRCVIPCGESGRCPEGRACAEGVCERR